MRLKIKTIQKGATLIEALVLLAIFAIITVAFSQAWAVGTRMIFEVRNRLGAASVAAEKMEIIRNLDYIAIGTKSSNGSGGWNYGIPAGEILQDETVVSNNRSYQVHTFIQYIDDPLDGVAGGSPSDLVPNDYKKVFITVTWGVASATQKVELSSIFVPQGVEQSAGGGVLSINTLNLAGNGIPGATIHIVNTQTNPPINITTTTDATGNLILPAAPASQQSYAISVSEAGYFPVTTYPAPPVGGFVPVDTNVSVVAGLFNQSTMVTDRVVNLTLKTKDVFGTDIPNVSLQIVGGKQIGTSPPKYAFDHQSAEAVSSGAGASYALTNESPGVYTVTPAAPAQYLFFPPNPTTPLEASLVLNPGQTSTTTLTFLNTTLGSVLLTVNKSADGTPLAGASVHLTNAVSGYDATVATDAFGRAYFPVSAPALPAGTYAVSISASGFVTKNDTIPVAGSLVQQTASLDAN